MSETIEIIKHIGENELQFSDFLQDSKQGVYRIRNKETFFKSKQSYNPLRELATVVKTDCETIEMPILNLQNSGWAKASRENNKFGENTSIDIKLYPLFARLKISETLFSKIQNFADHVKDQLKHQIANLERYSLLKGEKLDHQFTPIGIVNALSKDRCGKLILNEESASKSLLAMIAKLSSMYQSNATFLMSNKTLQRLNFLKQNAESLLFNGISKLFGYPIVLMDEIGDHILFGDFKQAVVIAENDADIIRTYLDNDAPNCICITMPSSIGVGIVNSEALVLANIDNTANTANAKE